MTCYDAPPFHSERCYQAGLRDGQRAAQAAVDEGAPVRCRTCLPDECLDAGSPGCYFGEGEGE